jgi:hypothetical protein
VRKTALPQEQLRDASFWPGRDWRGLAQLMMQVAHSIRHGQCAGKWGLSSVPNPRDHETGGTSRPLPLAVSPGRETFCLGCARQAEQAFRREMRPFPLHARIWLDPGSVLKGNGRRTHDDRLYHPSFPCFDGRPVRLMSFATAMSGGLIL